MTIKDINTPLGPLRLMAHQGELVYCNWICEECEPKWVKAIERYEEIPDMEDGNILRDASEQIDAYLSGLLKEFKLPVRLCGTDFQRKVWLRLLEIPYGTVVSYKELACSLGKRGSARAVANACGANPLAVIVPCHRVVGINGSGGYTGGIEKKKWLLQLEKETLEEEKRSWEIKNRQ